MPKHCKQSTKFFSCVIKNLILSAFDKTLFSSCENIAFFEYYCVNNL